MKFYWSSRIKMDAYCTSREFRSAISCMQILRIMTTTIRVPWNRISTGFCKYYLQNSFKLFVLQFIDD